MNAWLSLAIAIVAEVMGISPPSYDKQFVRDWLETQDWNKRAPGPRIPAEVIAGTAAKYAEALQRLAGITLD
jgi:phosphoribosylaminoimidazole-succinocarboxamide synthase